MGCTYVYLATWKCMICFNNFSLFDREPTNTHTRIHSSNSIILQWICPRRICWYAEWISMSLPLIFIIANTLAYPAKSVYDDFLPPFWLLKNWKIFHLFVFPLRSARKSPFLPLNYYYFIFFKWIEIEKLFMLIQ